MSSGGRRTPRGNRFYSLSYALESIRSYPFRALSLAITLSLGLSLIGSVLIWADTGVQVSVNNYFDNTAFQMLVEAPPGQEAILSQADQYAASSSLVKDTFKINSTIGLVYGSRLPNDTVYGLDEPLYSSGMKDCQVLFVDNQFLETARRSFLVDGEFSLREGEALVSVQFLTYVHQVYGITLTVNSTFDLELLMNAPAGPSGPIGDMSRTSLRDLRIVGVYEVLGYNSLIEQAFPSIMRSNYAYVHYDTPVLGIRDSVMILSDSVDTSGIEEHGFFRPRLFIRASPTALVAAGPDKIAENLLTLKARLEEQFDVTVYGLGEILYLQRVVDTYRDTTPLISLNLPLFILAMFLSVFAADTFMAARRTEVSALRSKGASSGQIYGIFVVESALMAIVSVVFGITLSVVFAALIPSSVAFLQFDWDVYQFYLQNTVLTPTALLYSTLFCIVPPLLFIVYAARKATRAEIGVMMVEGTEPISEGDEGNRFTLGISLFLLAMVLGAALLLPADPLLISLELGLGTAAWFFLAYNGSRVTRIGFANITSRLAFVLGEKNIVAAGNLKMRRGRIVPLMVVLVLTLSSTVAFTVQATTFQTDLSKEVRYAVGADLRVTTTSKPFNFTRTISSYPGVDDAMAVLQTWGGINNEIISIEALDPLKYSDLGYFDQSSFNGEDPEAILGQLARVENGILMSKYHADRWNKTIGDTITLTVGGRLAAVSITFVIVGLVHTAPGFGYASIADAPSSRLGAGFGLQAPHGGFAIANLEFVSAQTGINTARLFFGDLVTVSDTTLLLRSLNDLPGVSATTPETFNLYSHSFGTALFLSTVEGLFSIGFTMSLLLSIFSLTLFLGSIVRERRRDYAILRAVGASRKQVIRVVLAEFVGVVLASLTLSLILGMVFGYVLSIVVFSMSPFSRMLAPVIVVPVGFLTVVVLLELVAMVGGSYLPAKEAAKTDPAIVLRNL